MQHFNITSSIFSVIIISQFILTQSTVGYFIGTDYTGGLTASQACNNAGGRLGIINSHSEFTEASSVASSSGYGWVAVALHCSSRDTSCSESPSKWTWFDSQNNNEELCDISVGGMDDLSLYQTWDQWNKIPEQNEYCVEFYSGKLVLEFCSNPNGIMIDSHTSLPNAALCQPLSYDISICAGDESSDNTKTDVAKYLIIASSILGGICVLYCICYLFKWLWLELQDRKKRSVSEIVHGETELFQVQTETNSTRKTETIPDSDKCTDICGCIRALVPVLSIIAYILQFPSYLSSMVGLIGDGGNVHNSCTSICTANDGYFDYSVCEYTQGDAYTFSGCDDVGGYSGANDDIIGCYPFEDSSYWIMGWKHADCWDYEYDQTKCESVTCSAQCDNACSWKIWIFVSIVFYSIITEFPTSGEQTNEDHALQHRYITKFLGFVMAYGNRCMMYGVSTSPWGLKFVCFCQFGYFLLVAWMAKIDFMDLRTDFKFARLQNLIIYMFGFCFISNLFMNIIGGHVGLVPLSDVWAVLAFKDWSQNMMFSISIFGVTMNNILEVSKQVFFCWNKDI